MAKEEMCEPQAKESFLSQQLASIQKGSFYTVYIDGSLFGQSEHMCEVY